MGRGKISMELITDERSRMVTYQKRKKGLIKKVQEFQVLCQVDACVIIMGPRFNYRCTDSETWPTDPTELKRIIDRYKQGKSSDIRMKRTQDLSDYFVTRKKKIEDEIGRVKRSNLEAKFPKWNNLLNYLTYQQLWSFGKSLETKIELAKKRVLEIKSYQFSINEGYKPAVTNNNFRHANVFQSNGTFGGSYSATFDHQQQGFYNQMLSLNVNPMDNPMMIAMKGEDFTQFGGIMPCNFDPTATILENMMMFNNPGLYPMSCHGPNKQPLLPNYLQGLMVTSGDSQKCNVSPQFGDFGGVDVFEENKPKGNYLDM